MKGIILAGGSGTRLYPLTKGVSKQLMPIYDKPMIYYPLSTLMIAGIREILIISTLEDLPLFKKILGNGSEIGLNFEYIVQPSPNGIAESFILGKDFIGSEDVCLILGDNIFYGHGISNMMTSAINNARNENKATIFGYHVNDPERYGVVKFNADGKALSIEEKPEVAQSNYAITGLYFYPNDVVKMADKIIPSSRGELEITSLNQIYLNKECLSVKIMGRGYAWLDTGTHESLLEASNFIEVIEKRQGLKVACIEEIAFEQGYIDKNQFLKLAKPFLKNQYGQYMARRAKEFN